jgi:uncharacterized protein
MTEMEHDQPSANSGQFTLVKPQKETRTMVTKKTIPSWSTSAVKPRNTFARQAIVFIAGALALLQSSMVVHAQASEQVPALRVTAPNGAVSILIGSMHIAAEGLRQPADSVMAGIKRYVIEGASEKGALPPMAFIEEASEIKQKQAKRADWSKSLTQAQLDKLRQNLLCIGGTAEIEPWLDLALSRNSAAMAADVAMRPCAPAGLLSRDALLARAASAKKIPTSVLESQEGANKQRLAVPERIYRQHFEGSFTPQAAQGLRRVVNALNDGDYEMVTVVLKELSANSGDAELFLNLMVTQRNRAWMPNLTRFFDEGQALVNVGAAHLPGSQGLIELLRQRNYKLVPIELPAGDGR